MIDRKSNETDRWIKEAMNIRQKTRQDDEWRQEVLTTFQYL